MNSRIITDISNYIFVSDAPEKVDRYNGNYQSDCEFFTDVLMKNGVPADAVIRENKAGHTRDNAFLSRKIVDEKGIKLKTALIVCKAFHARRCLMLYQMAFPDVEIKVCPFHHIGEGELFKAFLNGKEKREVKNLN